jgi:prepilin-type processing-associated H-X9-DG protein
MAITQKAKCVSNLHAIGAAFLLYAGEHDQLPPDDGTEIGCTAPSLWRYNGKMVNLGLLFEYVGEKRQVYYRQYTPDLFMCPADRKNPDPNPGSTTSYWPNWGITTRPERKMHLGSLSANTIAVLDGGYWWEADPPADYNHYHGGGGFNALFIDGRVAWVDKEKTAGCAPWDWNELIDLK